MNSRYRTDNLTVYSENGPDHSEARSVPGYIRPNNQVPILVIGVPAIKCPARCFGGSTTTPSQTMRFTVCPLTQDQTVLNSRVSYPGRVSPDFGGNNSVRP